jgi:hypothetical protein
MEDALDYDRVVMGGIEDEVAAMHRDPHARSVLLA